MVKLMGQLYGVGQALLEQIYYSRKDFYYQVLLWITRCPGHWTFLFRYCYNRNTCNISSLWDKAWRQGGTTPALGVVVNAIVDALSEFGVKHIEMPTTSEKVWRAIKSSRKKFDKM